MTALPLQIYQIIMQTYNFNSYAKNEYHQLLVLLLIEFVRRQAREPNL